MDLAQAIWSTEEIAGSLRHLPPTAHLLAAGGVIVGLVLWAAGERILRLVFAALAAVSGGGAGFFLLPTIAPETVAGFPSPHVGLFGGALIGLLLGIILYRFAVAVLLAGGLGVAAVLISAAVVQFQPVADSEALRRDYEELSSPFQAPLPPSEEGEGEPPEPEAAEPDETGEPGEAAEDGQRDHIRDVMETMRPVAERVRIFLEARAAEFGEAWSALNGRQQGIVVSSSLAGVVAGFILGLIFPRRSAAAATAMAGAAVWMPSLLWLLQRMDAPGADRLLLLTPAVWLAAWAGAAVLGFGIQTVGTIRWRRRRS